MDKHEDPTLQMLRSIKRWIAVGAIGFVFIGVGVAAVSVAMVQVIDQFEEDTLKEECADRSSRFTWATASDLFERNKLDKLMKAVDKRLTTHPNDATAHYFKAKVYYMRKEWSQALDSLANTERLAPRWSKRYVEPLREQIRKQDH